MQPDSSIAALSFGCLSKKPDIRAKLVQTEPPAIKAWIPLINVCGTSEVRLTCVAISAAEYCSVYPGGFAIPEAGGGTTETDQISFTYNVDNNNNSLFTADGQPDITEDTTTNPRKGILTFTPAPNANGEATVSVTVKDSGQTPNGGVDTSATRTFTIKVDGINDSPVLSADGFLTADGSSGNFTAAPLLAIDEDVRDSAGTPVSTFLDTASVNDVEEGKPQGVAIVETDADVSKGVMVTRLDAKRPFMVGYRGRLIPSLTPTVAGKGSRYSSKPPSKGRRAVISPSPTSISLMPLTMGRSNVFATRIPT